MEKSTLQNDFSIVSICIDCSFLFILIFLLKSCFKKLIFYDNNHKSKSMIVGITITSITIRSCKLIFFIISTKIKNMGNCCSYTSDSDSYYHTFTLVVVIVKNQLFKTTF